MRSGDGRLWSPSWIGILGLAQLVRFVGVIPVDVNSSPTLIHCVENVAPR
ncbi:hypothetical protein ACX80W_00115 [Arthrobacter sp. TMN-37]